MAIIVEDGSGVTNANSYVSVAESQAYFTTKGITVTITEEALINATQYVDLVFGRRFKGKMLSGTQSLQWPRTTFTYDFGTVASGTIPKELKITVNEAARLFIGGTDLFNDVVDGNIRSITNTVEGAVSQSISYFAPNATDPRSNLGKFIAPLLEMSSAQTVRVR